MNKRKYLVYKITNRFNNKIYIGVHSTLNENDRYMGSGIEIKEALKKEGRKSFVKEILFTFDTKEEMLAKEKELVTKEFCMQEDTYNRIEGGGVYATIDMVSVKDKTGNNLKVYRDDPRYLSGELVGMATGTVIVRDKENNILQISKTDPRYLSGEFISIAKGFIVVKDKDNKTYSVKTNDPKYLSGEYIAASKGQPGNKSFLGKQHSEDTKLKMSIAANKRTGEKNSSFGTCWITNGIENKKIKKENIDEYLNVNWVKGRR